MNLPVLFQMAREKNCGTSIKHIMIKDCLKCNLLNFLPPPFLLSTQSIRFQIKSPKHLHLIYHTIITLSQTLHKIVEFYALFFNGSNILLSLSKTISSMYLVYDS